MRNRRQGQNRAPHVLIMGGFLRLFVQVDVVFAGSNVGFNVDLSTFEAHNEVRSIAKCMTCFGDQFLSVFKSANFQTRLDCAGFQSTVDKQSDGQRSECRTLSR